MKKTHLKLTLDILMITALPCLMAYSLIGERFHEVLGVASGCLFIVHNILNRAFYKNIFRGKYNALRVLMLATDLLLVIDILLLMASGIILSTFVFAFVDIERLYGAARLVHLSAAYWGFLLMSFHAGIHIRTAHHSELTCHPELVSGSLSGSDSEMPKQVRHDRIKRIVFLVVAAIISTFGIYSFIKNNFFQYLFLRTHFVFLDFERPRVLFFIEYISVMFLFSAVGVVTKHIFIRKLTNLSQNHIDTTKHFVL